MSNIDEYLEQILEARYGRDVRQSIHDGIKKCYEDGKAQPSSWGTLAGKPFDGIGTGLSVDEEGNLNAEGGAGASSWEDLTDKPFENIGTGLSVDEEGNLNAEGEAIPDNVAYLGEETIPSTPTPRDADLLGGQEPSYYKDANTLQGHNADYYAKASDFKWKKQGEYTPSQEFTLPTTGEIMLIAEVPNRWNQAIYYCIAERMQHAPIDMISTTTNDAIVRIDKNNEKWKIITAMLGPVDYIDDGGTRVIVYYR